MADNIKGIHISSKDVLMLILGTVVGGLFVWLLTSLLGAEIESLAKEAKDNTVEYRSISKNELDEIIIIKGKAEKLLNEIEAHEVSKTMNETRTELRQIAVDTAKTEISSMTQFKLGNICFAPRKTVRCSVTWGNGSSADLFVLITGDSTHKKSCPGGYNTDSNFNDYVLANVQCD